MQPCSEDNRSFFEKLQNEKGLDLRDNRGKRHDLAVILVGVMLALLGNRDGNLSGIHRCLKNHYEPLVEVLGGEKKTSVSRSQLPIILAEVSVSDFDRLLFAHYGIKLNELEKKRFAVDGKQLRGSIGKGNKRGAASVQAVAHEDLQVAAQEYYSGEKEWEVPAVRKLLSDNGLASLKISFDAWHWQVASLESITREGGKYLVGMKDNQKELKKQISVVPNLSDFS